MQSNEFLELVKIRRSCRSFKTDPIPDKYLENILEAARWAMSGANSQPWEFIVVKNQETRNRIVDIYTEYQKEKWYIEQTRIQELRHPGSASHIPDTNVNFRNAPVIIIICGDNIS
jgi:nitroreductase